MLSKETFPAAVEFLHQSFGQPSGYGDSGRYYAYQLSTNGVGVYNGAILYLHQWDNNTEVKIRWHPMPTLSMMLPNKSLQATRDGRSSSAIAEDVISPACLSSGR